MREFEYHSGLLRDLAGCFVDYRDPRYIEHSVQELVSQRIYGLILECRTLVNKQDQILVCVLIAWVIGLRQTPRLRLGMLTFGLKQASQDG